MSHTPPDRDDDSPAPGGSGNPWLRFFAWAMLALVVYVLSIGPVCSLAEHGDLPIKYVDAFYRPLDVLPNSFKAIIGDYVMFWDSLRI